MCYANLIYARGPERFADELAERGISGLIVPDLPLEEAAPMRAACDAAGVALVPLVAPTTPDDRLAAIGAGARGFGAGRDVPAAAHAGRAAAGPPVPDRTAGRGGPAGPAGDPRIDCARAAAPVGVTAPALQPRCNRCCRLPDRMS